MRSLEREEKISYYLQNNQNCPFNIMPKKQKIKSLANMLQIRQRVQHVKYRKRIHFPKENNSLKKPTKTLQFSATGPKLALQL